MASALLHHFKKKLAEFELRKKEDHDDGGDVGAKADGNASCWNGDETTRFMLLLQKWYKQLMNRGTPLDDAERDEIIAHLSEGVDVNARSTQGVPVLIMVTECFLHAGHYLRREDVDYSMKVFRMLLENGVDVNVQGIEGRTSLLLAIEDHSSFNTRSDEDAFILMLLEGGAHVNRESASDKAWPTTPLLAAVHAKKKAVVEMLLSKGANVNAKEGSDSALYIATLRAGEIYPDRVSSIMDTLLKHGADVKNDESRLLTTAISRAPESVERLLAEIYGQPEPESHNITHKGIFNKPPNDSSSNEVYKFLMGRLDELMLMGTETTTATKSEETLCSSCQDFENNAVYRQWFNHSPNSDVMIRSILNGCTLCQMIKDCLPSAFDRVQLYLYTALSDADTLSRNYYERVIIRGEKLHGVTFGELRLAAIDENTSTTLLQAAGYKDVTTSSDCSFQLAAHWLKICLADHRTCQFSHDKPPILPTRVVDVGPSDGSEDPRLFCTDGDRGFYVSLSYCWGATANLRTELETIDSFQKTIPLQKIPKTIREAIIITRRLGIRYLWVDTLCIIQNSNNDWLSEAKNIASVYQNCVLTLAAADAVDSEGGLFRPRKRSRTRPVKFAPLAASFKETAHVFAFGDRLETNDAMRCESRLDQRGWVLQEQLLSPRTLNYSSGELYWECSTLNASESYPAGIPRDHDQNFERQYFTELKRKISGSYLAADKERVHMLWQNIVMLYSRRGLSVETDKLVALAGAASQVAKVLEDRFFAGLWVNWLWRDLLWRVEGDVNSVDPYSVRSKVFQAPSWSWASIKSPIIYDFPKGTGRARYYPCIQILQCGKDTCRRSNKPSGHITIRGVIVRKLKFPTKERVLKADQPTAALEDESTTAEFWKPDTRDIIFEETSFLIVAASHSWAVCLGIMPTLWRKEEYRRVGLAYCPSPYSNLSQLQVRPQVFKLV